LIVSKKNIPAQQLYQSAEFSSDLKQSPFFTPSSFIPDLWFIPGCEQKELIYYKDYESTGEKRAEINQKKCIWLTLAIGTSILMTYFAHTNIVNGF
jgi:hypothetical protein